MANSKDQYISIALIWFERFQEASRCIGTEYELNSIWKFYHSLLDIGEGKDAIKTIVTDYITNTWRPMVETTYKELKKDYEDIVGIEGTLYNDAERNHIKKLFDKILQTIQESGKGWPTTQELTNFNITQT